MNSHLKEAFARIKPVCDLVMVNPSPEHVTAFVGLVCELKKEILQELQQYMLFPFITHLQSKEIETKYEVQRLLIDGMKEVIQRVKVCSFEMCMKIEMGLLSLVFEKPKPGMIADVPEELKLSVMQCLTTLMLCIDQSTRIKMVENQVPLLAQAVFVSVHLAKLEKLRGLRLAAINCLCAHTASHPQLTDKRCHITDPALETAVVNMMSCILPGVLAALQDVATCTNNPGHAIVVAALNATHRVLCLTMHNKHLNKKESVTAEDFVNLLAERAKADKDVSTKGKTPKDIPKRTPEWYTMAGDKLAVVVKSLVPLVTHEHYRVRKELAVLCYRIVSECNLTMQPSLTMALDVLISLSNDQYKEVSDYCTKSIKSYFLSSAKEKRLEAVDSLCENFFTTLNCLPRILNNIDANRKYSALNLLHGYLSILCDDARPQRLTAALSPSDAFPRLCDALLAAAALHADVTLLTRHAATDITLTPSTDTPWRRLRHLDTKICETRFQQICQKLGEAESGELILDRLLELFYERRSCELVYIMNFVASAPKSNPRLAERVISTYIEEDVWHLPLEVARERPLSREETLDETIYNPRAWIKDSVPGLFEGATEVRYTDISYSHPRIKYVEANSCASLAEAQRNMAASCLLAEGVGLMAGRLGAGYQKYRLKTLCMVLERVGSKYENLHLAGVKALTDISKAFGHASVSLLIAENADYFTSQVTSRLKKAWSVQSALQILSVVMEYSDAHVLDHLYGIVEDVLVQSCDEYYQKNLYAYLQVFLTFITCIRKWFPTEPAPTAQTKVEIDILQDVIEYENNKNNMERLLNMNDFERDSGKTVEEMYKEDLKRREEEMLDYGESVAPESPPIPKHVTITLSILKRCVHFITSEREESMLAFETLTVGLAIVRLYEDELLPLIHVVWGAEIFMFITIPETPPIPKHVTVTLSILKRCVHFITSEREESMLALEILTVGLPIVRQYEDELLPLVHVVWAPLVSRFEGEVPVVRKAFDLFVTLADVSRDFIKSRAVKEVLPQIYKFLKRSSSDSHLKDSGAAYRASAAYALQAAVLSAAARLVVALRLRRARFSAAASAVHPYLANTQPKPLQMLAVRFFKDLLDYDYGAAWQHLRRLCNNNAVLLPPKPFLPPPDHPSGVLPPNNPPSGVFPSNDHPSGVLPSNDAPSGVVPPPSGFLLPLHPVRGTPYETDNAAYDTNVKLIFYVHK